MKKSEVSPEFISFLGKNHSKIEDAKRAEARGNNVPLPIGAAGTCIMTGFKLSKSKDKVQTDGSTKEGTPFIEMELKVIDNSEHAGKTVKKQWWFMDSAKMDAAGRFQIFLDDMEKLGLPREVRMNHESPAEIGDYFLSKEDLTFHFGIVHNQYNTLDDQKEVKLTPIQSHIAATDDVNPPSTSHHKPVTSKPAPVDMTPAPAPVAAPVASSPGLPKVGDEVFYLDQKCKVLEVYPDSGKVHLKGIDNPGMEKITLASNLDS